MIRLLRRLGIFRGEGAHSLENRLIGAVKLLIPSNWRGLRQITRHPFRVVLRILLDRYTQELLLPEPTKLEITPVNLLALLQVWGKIPLLRTETENNILVWQVGPGIELHTQTQARSDVCALEEVFLRRVYGESYQGLRVLDVGGYNGESTLFFLMQGAQEVACVEPAPTLVANIQKHLERNGLQARAKVFPIALGAVEGEGKLLLTEEMLGNRLLPEASSAAPACQLTVPVWSFARLLQELGWEEIDVAKIDCEGCEYGLFAATPDALLRRVRVWIVEVHGPVETIANRLKGLGYEVRYELYWREAYNLWAWLPGVKLPWSPGRHEEKELGAIPS